MAKDQSCIACGTDDGTVVLAHRNEHKSRAAGLDFWALELCNTCHREYDQGKSSREEKRRFFNDHYPAQILRWVERGVMKVCA
mgnify:CR=1 FL=1